MHSPWFMLIKPTRTKAALKCLYQPYVSRAGDFLLRKAKKRPPTQRTLCLLPLRQKPDSSLCPWRTPSSAQSRPQTASSESSGPLNTPLSPGHSREVTTLVSSHSSRHGVPTYSRRPLPCIPAWPKCHSETLPRGCHTVSSFLLHTRGRLSFHRSLF